MLNNPCLEYTAEYPILQLVVVGYDDDVDNNGMLLVCFILLGFICLVFILLG